MNKRIEVAVAIIRDDQDRFLIGQRTVKDRYYQKWEFPGGKLEAGETPEQALSRELKEELGINVINSQPMMLLAHDYPDRQVLLHVQIVSQYAGQVSGVEGQALQWVSQQEIAQLDFLQGNEAIVKKLNEVTLL